MRRILAGLAVVGMLMVASPAQANGDYYQRSVTKAKPMSVTWEHTSGTGIFAQTWWGSGSGPVTLTVVGPPQSDGVAAGCTATGSGPSVECSVNPVICDTSVPPVCFTEDAPFGSYTATVTVASGTVQQVTLAISD
jgi:hypothetical protein